MSQEDELDLIYNGQVNDLKSNVTQSQGHNIAKEALSGFIDFDKLTAPVFL